jgi:glycine betaine/proline transport system substrate-binding protein
MPTMEADIAPYREAGRSTPCAPTSKGAKYTLATNAKPARAGHRGFR